LAGRSAPAHGRGPESSRQAERFALEAAIRRGWLLLHESGTYVKFTQAGAELFA
jgi:hypothetical protein